MKSRGFTATRFMMAALIFTSCVGCDQITKHIAIANLQNEPPQSFFGDTLRFELAFNPGGFLSLGAALPDQLRLGIFIAFNTTLLLGIITYLIARRPVPTTSFAPLLLILGGGVGNMIDRVWNDGLVTDFINVGIGSVRTGVFNVADMAVMCGALVLLFVSSGHQRINDAECGRGQES